jgi:hypothetical protein
LGIASWIGVPHWVMSERSIYLRDQAIQCRHHADSLTDGETRALLRKLAVEYDAAAVEIESKE